MIDLDTVRYKYTAHPDWVEKIHLVQKDGAMIDGDRQSFNIKKSPLRFEYFLWKGKNGNITEQYLTESELLEKEDEHKIKLVETLKTERNNRILEADKWELPTVMLRFNLTTQQIMDYKQKLLDMPETHTTIEQLENPSWPSKLIEQELL